MNILSLENHEQTLLTVSHVADPAYAFSIIFPIISTGSTLLAADILMVSVVAEWLNAVLKWILREDRPFWWVRETNIYGEVYPHLRQTHLTCETGPGSPSGHVMGAAAMLYVLINAFINKYSKRNVSDACKTFMRYTFWGIYIFSIVLVCVSRMYIATHFPHQCILGAVIGFIIGYLFGNSNTVVSKYWHNCNKLHILMWVLITTGISISTYWLQKAFGIDPQWSIKMAFKWCEHPENVHVNTTPLFSLVRDFGLGLGLVSVSPIIERIKRSQQHSPMVAVACVLVYCTALLMAQTAVPVFDAKIFYVCHALLYSTMPYVLIGFMPEFATVKRKVQ